MKTLKTLKAEAIVNRNNEDLKGLISELDALGVRASQNVLDRKITKQCIAQYAAIMDVAKPMLKANYKLAKAFGFKKELDLSDFGDFMKFFEL